MALPGRRSGSPNRVPLPYRASSGWNVVMRGQLSVTDAPVSYGALSARLPGAVIGGACGVVGVMAGEPHQPNTLLHAEDDVNPSLGPIWLIWFASDRAMFTVCSNSVTSDFSAAAICRCALAAA
jgi:hypothetical protein